VPLPKNGDGEYAATRGLTLPAAFVLLNTGKIQEAGCIDTPIKCILWLAVATRFKPFSIDIRPSSKTEADIIISEMN
jgi:hypothetical protein